MTSSKSNIPVHLGLRAGDWVVVRSKEEILATLDENACLDSMPFQPEMFRYCGHKFQVWKTAHKTCDTIKKTGGRRLFNTVHLDNLRCDGADHGGCQADCLFFWKEAWLKPADKTDTGDAKTEAAKCTEETVYKATQRGGEDANKDDPAWSCQTTALYDATELLKWWDVRQYIKDITSGNHSVWHIFKLMVAAIYRKLVHFGYGYKYLVNFYNWFQKLHNGKPFPIGSGDIPDGEKTPAETLNLKPGEWVEVKSPEEIRSTITKNGFNKGMRFDMEMLKYSGERYKVQMRVEKLIDEITGKMLHMKTPCIQLENVYCRAECTPMRLGCPRASNTYWREIWLKRVDGPKDLSSE